MTDPLFAALPGPTGEQRRTVDARIDEMADAGHRLEPVLVLIVRALADRIDWLNASRATRGLVMLTAEFRAAWGDLVADQVDDVDTVDPLEAALAAFRAAEAGNPPGSVPAH